MYALHYNDTKAGQVFSQSGTPLGLALPVYTGTAIAGGMPIWNPPNSNRLVELISTDIDFGSGTSTYGTIGLMALPLAAIATGALCTAFASTNPVNGFLLAGTASKVQSSNAGTVTVTAGTANPPTSTSTAPGWYRGLNSVNLEAQTGTAHGTLLSTYVFNGTVIIPPGVMIYLAATIATSALFCSTIVWKEIPINTQGG